jgi:hypothetical protein
MAKLNGTIKSLNFVYDFTVDGGAVSAIPTGIILPVNFLIYGAIIAPIVDLTSGGLAVVNIGNAANSTQVWDNAHGTVGTFVDYNKATYGFNSLTGGIFTGAAESLINPLGYSYEVTVNIGVAPLTAGKFICSILYLESN